ncbi:zinc finger protein-domain-containing protein, partial [Bipolaris maydis]
TNDRYRCIGKGFCGSVWTLESTTPQTAIKREDGGPGRSVTNDYNMHVKVVESAQQHAPSTPLCIPQCHRLIQATDPWWHSNLVQFPRGYSACRALQSERIPKVPRSISNKIVDLFCAGNTPLCDFIKNNPDDDACLIRPYLGRRRRRRRRCHRQEGASQSRFQRFSLRNVPLHLDQMEVLGLDVQAYAGAMAEALALMYWGARIDANDVEFVLASARADHTPTFASDYLGIHCMWILDFDCCRPIQVDETGVEQACAAFYKNDPFYPRPGSGEAADEELWVLFKQRFLESSWRVMGEASQDKWFLADMLVERIEDEGRSRRK